MPTSRTMRVRPAISFACSILQTASIVRCMSVAVTGYRLTPLPPMPQAALHRGRLRLVGLVAQLFAWPRDLANFDFALPAWNMNFVKIQEAARHIEDLGL